MAELTWQERKRLAAVFGDALPDITSDETAEATEPTSSDEWLKAQVPPHHGTP